MRLFYRTSCRTTLLQIISLLLIVGVLLFLNRNMITQYYVNAGSGQIGLFLNGLIVLLFLLGMLRIIMLLLRYLKQQHVVRHLSKHCNNNSANPVAKLSKHALIVRRYEAVRLIAAQNSPINHAALASTLAASENAKLSLVRFVNNTLILMGVFGTIVSLSIALSGASGLLGSPESMQNMGVIIGGMSTALSTTLTAIVCYMIYTYFYLRLNSAKTHLLSNIEDTTSLYILPKFSLTEEKMLHNVTQLTIELRQAAQKMNETQVQFTQVGKQLQLAVDNLHQQVSNVDTDMQEMKDIVRQGFRLEIRDK